MFRYWKFILLLTALIQIGSYYGRVAVYEGTEPQWVSDVPLAVLPEADQAALSHGIVVVSKAGACRVTEDYCS